MGKTKSKRKGEGGRRAREEEGNSGKKGTAGRREQQEKEAGTLLPYAVISRDDKVNTDSLSKKNLRHFPLWPPLPFPCALSLQPCLTLCNPKNRTPPGSSVHGIFQARVLSGLPFSSPGDLPDPGIKSESPALQADSLPTEL